MLQLNPFLTSIASPVAAKAVQVVAHVAHQTGQSFLKTFTQFGEQSATAACAVADTESLQSKLASVSTEFRQWLDQQGVVSPYELQFHLADNGEPIANVTGSDSGKIVDLLFGDNNWLSRLSSLASEIGEQTLPGVPGTATTANRSSAKLSIRSEAAYAFR